MDSSTLRNFVCTRNFQHVKYISRDSKIVTFFRDIFKEKNYLQIRLPFLCF